VTSFNHTAFAHNCFVCCRPFGCCFPSLCCGFGFNFCCPLFSCLSCPAFCGFGSWGVGSGPFARGALAYDFQPLFTPELAAPVISPEPTLAAPAPPAPAQVDVRLPFAEAEVWFDGQKTTQTGDVRYFESPPLDPNGQYVYEVRAAWTADGEEVMKTRRIRVRAGDHVIVDFTAPPPKERGVPERLDRIR
jgi:uncharacterized protein (TIGR03000 family)